MKTQVFAAVPLPIPDTWWRECAERGLAEMVGRGVDFTADDLRDLGVPEPDHPNRWGQLFKAAAARGDITVVGFAASAHPSRRGGSLRVWRGLPKVVAA